MPLECLKGEAGWGHGALQCSIPSSEGLHGLGSGSCVYLLGFQTGDLVSKSWGLSRDMTSDTRGGPAPEPMISMPWDESWVDAALSWALGTAVSFAQRLRADEDTARFATPRNPFDHSTCCCRERCSVWFEGG